MRKTRVYRYSERGRLFQRTQTDTDRGRSEKRRESKTKGETERNAAECMGGDELLSGERSLSDSVNLVLCLQRCHAPALLTSSDNGKNSIKLIN